MTKVVLIFNGIMWSAWSSGLFLCGPGIRYFLLYNIVYKIVSIMFFYGFFFFFIKKNHKNIQLSPIIPHSRAGDLEVNIPSDCRSEYSEVKVG